MTERRPLPYEWPDLRQRLQQNMGALLARLFPGGRVPAHGVFTPLNPTRGDRRPGSFVIYADGPKAGGWVEFATGGAEKGDVFQLIRYVERLQADMDAYWWAVEWLGLAREGFAERPRTKAEDVVARERREADRLAEAFKAAEAEEARSHDLFKLWLSLPGIEGTPAERYLRHARNLPFPEALGDWPGAMRWAEAVDAPPDAETGEIKIWRNVIVSAMTRGSKVTALHRTYLLADGSGKRQLGASGKSKLMIGSARGAAIRLSKGASGLSPSEAVKRGKFGPGAIGEGIETTGTVACARPDLRCWAAGSLSLMRALEWPDCMSAVVLLKDHPKSAGEAEAFGRAEAHWRAQARGRPFAVVAPDVGKDFNDWGRSA